MFFKEITLSCTEANLVKKVPLTKARQAVIKRKLITQDKTVVRVTSAPIATHANAAAIRAKMLQQGMQNLVTAIKMNKQQHKCINMGGGHHYDLATIERKGENVKGLFLNLKEATTILAAILANKYSTPRSEGRTPKNKESAKNEPRSEQMGRYANKNDVTTNQLPRY
jgi:hypothetical protein